MTGDMSMLAVIHEPKPEGATPAGPSHGGQNQASAAIVPVTCESSAPPRKIASSALS